MSVLAVITFTVDSNPDYTPNMDEIDIIHAKIISLTFADKIKKYLKYFLFADYEFHDIRDPKLKVYTGIEKDVLQKIYKLDKYDYYCNGNGDDIFKQLQEYFKGAVHKAIRGIELLDQYLRKTYRKKYKPHKFSAEVHVGYLQETLSSIDKSYNTLNFTHNQKFKSINKDVKNVIISYF